MWTVGSQRIRTGAAADGYWAPVAGPFEQAAGGMIERRNPGTAGRDRRAAAGVTVRAAYPQRPHPGQFDPCWTDEEPGLEELMPAKGTWTQ